MMGTTRVPFGAGGSKTPSRSGGFQGIGFAIPIEAVYREFTALR